MLGFLGAGVRDTVGVDIGSSHVKVASFSGVSGKHPKVTGLGISPTPQGAVLDGALGNRAAVKNTISLALEENKVRIKGKFVTIGLRGLNVLYKRLILPNQEESEMAEQVLREAQQQIDSDLEDWIVDHQVISEQDDQGQVAVLLVAGRRTVIEDLQELITELGGQPKIVDCDVFAVANAFEQGAGRSYPSTLFLDIGRDSSKLLLTGPDSLPQLVRSFSLGGQHLTDLIARSAGVASEQAESLKISASESGNLFKEKRLADATSAHLNEIMSEIAQTLEFFAGADNGGERTSAEHIVLSGGAASTAGLAQALGQRFKCQVSFLDPFSGLRVASGLKATETAPPHVFSTVIGLGLRYLGDKDK